MHTLARPEIQDGGDMQLAHSEKQKGFSHLKSLTLGHPKPRISGILGYL